MVEPLAKASIWLNEWIGFTDDKRLEQNHPSVRRVVRRLKDRGYYVDLRRVFEHQSIAFLVLTSSALYYLTLQFASGSIAMLSVILCQALVFSYCTMW
jgi:hypothetical protein